MRRKLIITALFGFAALIFLVTKGSMLDPVLKYVGNPVQIRFVATQVLFFGTILAVALTIIRTIVGILVTIAILLIVYFLIQHGKLPFL